jgi:hypothetical protein
MCTRELGLFLVSASRPFVGPFPQGHPYSLGPSCVRAHACMCMHALDRHDNQLLTLQHNSVSGYFNDQPTPPFTCVCSLCWPRHMHKITRLASAACGADLQARTGATCRWRASAHRSLECNTSPSLRLVSGKSQRTALVAGELNAPSIQPSLDCCTPHVVQSLAQSPC